ncbi:MAG: glutamine synthetase family protein [Anaerolineae bacterium]
MRLVETCGLDSSDRDKACQEIVQRVQKEGIRGIRVGLCDLHGISRAKTVSAEHLEHVLCEGMPMQTHILAADMQVVDVQAGTSYGMERLLSNFRLIPDPHTFRVLHWSPGWASMIGDPYFMDGSKAMIAPRHVLRQVLDRVRQMGYRVRFGSEMEFYVFDGTDGDGNLQPTTPDHQCFSEHRQAEAEPVLGPIMEHLARQGIAILDFENEHGPGQFELNCRPEEGLAAIDEQFFIRALVKEVMRAQGKMATFMCQPTAGSATSGLHFHQSLLALDGKNAFADSDAEDGLSSECRFYVGGQLHHAAALTAFACPTITGYKRYAPGTFAPVNVSWGLDNRTVMIRVTPERDQATHIENRLPEPGCNPYLLAASMVAAGLDGIERQIDPGPPQQRDVGSDTSLPPVPRSLEASLAALEADETLREWLGDEMTTAFLALKRFDLEQFRSSLTDWEIKYYRSIL